MKSGTLTGWVIVGIALTYIGFHAFENYIHETVIYPPEILTSPYLAINYSPNNLDADEPSVRFDPKKPIIYVGLQDGTITDSYDYSLHLLSRTKTMDYRQRPFAPHLSDPELAYLQPGSCGVAYNPEEYSWKYDELILDLPTDQKPLDEHAPYDSDDFRIESTGVRIYSPINPVPRIGMTGWSLQFDGKWSNEMGAYATGDNLFGVAEKHRLPLAFFSGTWTLIVHGQPVFRQKVRNLPGGMEFFYSPVYGLVLLQYESSEGHKVLYVIKVPASGPNAYADIKRRETVIGTKPSWLVHPRWDSPVTSSDFLRPGVPVDPHLATHP